MSAKKKKAPPPLDLTPNPDNPRRISARQLAMLKKSMAEFGDLGGIIKNLKTGTIVGGHQRTRVLQSDPKATIDYAGRNHEPDKHGTVAWGWVRANGERFSYREVLWEKKTESAAMIAANKHGGEWDQDKLRALITNELGDIDPDLLGFSDDEMTALLATAPSPGKTDPDELPDAPERPVTVLGDVWILGDHRIVCGDSEDAKTAKLAIAGSKPKAMITDPPYGVEYDPTWRIGAGVATGGAKGKVLNDHRADWRKAYKHFPGDTAYVWHAGVYSSDVAAGLAACGFEIRSQIIWNKGQLVMGRGDYHWQHEPCWYAVRKGKRGHYNGDRTQTTVWDITPGPGYQAPPPLLFTIGGTYESTTVNLRPVPAVRLIHTNIPPTPSDTFNDNGLATHPTTVWDIPKPQKNETGHGKQKPVECMMRPMLNNTVPGDDIYEPFSGSGTTIIAGEMTGRRVHAIELNPAYVDMGVERWQNFTGRAAVHETTGKTFEEMRKTRLK